MLDASELFDVSEAVRNQAPLVHNITNDVVLNISADAISAVGGTQATLRNIEEAAELTAISSATAINVGTPDTLWHEAATVATKTANDMNKPWVLDPVAYGLLPFRMDVTHALLENRPTCIKGNASEIMALAGVEFEIHGAETRNTTDEAEGAAHILAEKYGCVVGITGATDLVVADTRSVRLDNGDPLMPATIGTGCMLTSVTGAFLGVGADPFTATVAAFSHMAIAGECAAAKSAGPGSMKTNLMDALYSLDRETFQSRLKLSA